MKKSITILLAALLCACGFPIDKAEWTRAEEICAAQGGVKRAIRLKKLHAFLGALIRGEVQL